MSTQQYAYTISSFAEPDMTRGIYVDNQQVGVK